MPDLFDRILLLKRSPVFSHVATEDLRFPRQLAAVARVLDAAEGQSGVRGDDRVDEGRAGVPDRRRCHQSRSGISPAFRC